jgi:TetR/AcrR family transcriptional regulator, transcriptional repressor for nem operon
MKKQIQKIESKERILNVAARLFKKNGYSATGIDQIMSDAGLTAGAFYAHFKSKNDLLSQSLQHSLTHSFAAMMKGTEDLQKREKLNLLMSRYVSRSHRDLPEKGCALAALGAELNHSSSAAKALIKEHLQKWGALISDSLPEDLSAEEKQRCALALISQAVGTLLLSRMLKGDVLSDQLLSSFVLADQHNQ